MPNQNMLLDSDRFRPESIGKSFVNHYFSMQRLTSIAQLNEKQPTRYLPDTKDISTNKSVQFRAGNHCYTTLNSSIKYIAEIVYNEIGEGSERNRMSFASFEVWIAQNQGILRTFDKWLRKDIWGSTVSDYSPPSSIPESPAPVEGYARVNIKKRAKKLKMYKKHYLELKRNILSVYQSSSKANLVNVYILKDLEILFNRNDLKVKVKHSQSAHYRNLTICLATTQDFLRWSDALRPFLMESIEKFYSIRGKIGRGTFSTVNLAEKKSDSSQRFAIKTIDKESLTKEERNLIREEAKIIKSLNHENIIKFHSHYEDYKKTYYVFELVEGGDLLEYVLKKGNLPEPEARLIFKQMLGVLRYLHRNNILHRDLKPENILLRFDVLGNVKQIKLIDFGFATFFSKDDLPCLSCGTLNYAAPEVLVGEEYDEASDLFSCGVILYFM